MLDVQMPPNCLRCAAVIRPGVVMFGEMLPQAALYHSEQEVRACDLLLAIGSSLIVFPAANFPVEAKEHGATLVIINKDPTPLDDIADLVIRASAGEVLSKAVEGISR